MNAWQRVLLLGTVVSVGALGYWSHGRFSSRGVHPEAVELYEAVTRSLPPGFGAGDWLRVSGSGRSGANGLADAWLRDYPELSRAEHLELGRVRCGDLEAEVEVFFVLPGGRVSPCTFRFRFENRGWKVQGVEFARPDGDRPPAGGVRL